MPNEARAGCCAEGVCIDGEGRNAHGGIDVSFGPSEVRVGHDVLKNEEDEAYQYVAEHGGENW